MSALLRRLRLSRRGATSAEFALVVPLLLIFLFGIIDAGRFMWAMNEAEKATQAGARFAIVTDPVSSGLADHDFTSEDIPAGELIPASALGELVCTSSGCSCTSNCTGIGNGVDATAFNAIVARMQVFDPRITAANVEVSYRGSGFGFAGGEDMQISPLVTVTLKDMTFSFMTFLNVAQVTLPSFSTTLTAEDSSGAHSN